MHGLYVYISDHDGQCSVSTVYVEGFGGGKLHCFCSFMKTTNVFNTKYSCY